MHLITETNIKLSIDTNLEITCQFKTNVSHTVLSIIKYQTSNCQLIICELHVNSRQRFCIHSITEPFLAFYGAIYKMANIQKISKIIQLFPKYWVFILLNYFDF